MVKADPSKKHQFYFLDDLSFYSKEHGGTFHFFQLNVLHADEFIHSPEFKNLISFLNKIYPNEQVAQLTGESMQEFFHSLAHKKSVIDLTEEIHFNQKHT